MSKDNASEPDETQILAEKPEKLIISHSKSYQFNDENFADLRERQNSIRRKTTFSSSIFNKTLLLIEKLIKNENEVSINI